MPWNRVLAAGGVAGLAALAGRYAAGLARADRSWPGQVQARLSDLGEVDEVSILTLVERLTPDGSGLSGEPGVSYLIHAGGMRVLFDSGLSGGKAESALVHNAQMLGVPLGDLDAVVISHLHLDHVGGLRAVRRRTFGATRGAGACAHAHAPPARRYRGDHRPAGDRARHGRAAAAAADAVLAWLRHRTGAGGQRPRLWPGPDQRLRPSA